MGDIGTVMIVGLFIMLILGVPIAITLGLLTAVGVWMADSNPMIMAQRFLAGGSVSSLLAIPGFILAGELMSAGGLSRRLVRVASVFFGHLTGGLSMSTVVAGTFFGAISGSAPATTAAVGSIMIDELAAKGYKRGYAAAGFCVVSVLYARRMGYPRKTVQLKQTFCLLCAMVPGHYWRPWSSLGASTAASLHPQRLRLQAHSIVP